MDKSVGKKVSAQLRTAVFTFVGLFMALMIAIVISSVLFFSSAAQLIDTNAHSLVLNSCVGNAYSLETLFQNRMSYLEKAGSQFLSIDLNDDEAVAQVCRSAAAGSVFDHICFTRTDGTAVIGSGESKNISHRIYIQEALSGTSNIQPYTQCDFTYEPGDLYSVPCVTTRDRSSGSSPVTRSGSI